MIAELDQELEQRVTGTSTRTARAAGVVPRSPPPNCWLRSARSAASAPTPSSPATVASHPLEASSGSTQRHRLDRGGNRQLNAALYRIAITQARYHPAARAYLERKKAEGKTRREAIRCLKRLLARVVFHTLKANPALT